MKLYDTIIKCLEDYRDEHPVGYIEVDNDGKCTNCGEVFIPPKDHECDWVVGDIVGKIEKICVESVIVYKCRICGKRREE